MRDIQQEQTEETEAEFSVLSVSSGSIPGATGTPISSSSLAAPTCRAEIRWRRESDGGGSPDIDNRLPAFHSLGGGGREYKAVYVLSDAEIGLFSDEVVVNCAP